MSNLVHWATCWREESHHSCAVGEIEIMHEKFRRIEKEVKKLRNDNTDLMEMCVHILQKYDIGMPMKECTLQVLKEVIDFVEREERF